MLKGLSKKYNEYINDAIQIAKKSCMRCKHGAVIIQNGGIVACGHNYSTHQCVYHNKYSVHAEINAIFDFFARNKINNKNKKKVLHNAFMIVIRVDNDGSFKNSKPCSNCARMICKYNINTIFYSVSDLDKYKDISNIEQINLLDILRGKYKQLTYQPSN